MTRAISLVAGVVLAFCPQVLGTASNGHSMTGPFWAKVLPEIRSKCSEVRTDDQLRSMLRKSVALVNADLKNGTVTEKEMAEGMVEGMRDFQVGGPSNRRCSEVLASISALIVGRERAERTWASQKGEIFRDAKKEAVSAGVIGRWMDGADTGFPGLVTLTKEKGVVFMLTKFSDGSEGKYRMTTANVGGQTRYKEQGRQTDDYLVIRPNGDLAHCDGSGCWATAHKVK